jgi:hypothetical protein
VPVCVEAETTAEPRFAAELVFWSVFDEVDEALVDGVALPQHLGE